VNSYAEDRDKVAMMLDEALDAIRRSATPPTLRRAA